MPVFNFFETFALFESIKIVIFVSILINKLQTEKSLVYEEMCSISCSRLTLIDEAEKWPRSANIASVPGKKKNKSICN